tara:strand:+ start:1192 stop:2409 length:1218 start_codon:yes stop_codon:yes gene_type:complete
VKKEKIKYKNNIPNKFLDQKKTRNNISTINNSLKKILKEINKKKDIFHSFSKSFKLNLNTSELKKFRKFKQIIIIGMGGSILGTKAIYSFLHHKIKKKIIFFDNLDQCQIENFSKNKISKNNLFIVVSKSGNTIETLTNLNLIKKNKLNSLNTIVITEKKQNALNKFSKKKKILTIEHKNFIGGRYSVLSEVGMVPAYLMGLSISKIRKNLLFFMKKSQRLFLAKSISKISQIYLSKKINSVIFFNYCPELDNFVFWCQQLIAESLGKKKRGLMPVFSPAPKDHHSMLQLYLDGPQDKIFYVLSSNANKKLRIMQNLFGQEFSCYSNKELNEIKIAQKNAFTKVLKRKKIPYREIEVNEINEEVLGELFAHFIIEVTMIAKLIGVNAFDQPAVEEIKLLTKKNLS